MGGIVAKYMPMLDNYIKESIEVIFTLSTPHQEPPFAISLELTRFYVHLNSYWKNNHKYGNLKDVSLVSIAGGSRDYVLDSQLTSLDSIADESKSISVFSSGIGGVWSSADHECTTWCDQILQLLTRSIFHINKCVNNTSNDRMKILKNLWAGDHLEISHHLVEKQMFTLSGKVIYVPNLTTSLTEDFIAKLWLPPDNLKARFRFQFITNLSSKIEFYSCGNPYFKEYECLNLKSVKGFDYAPDINENFKIRFKAVHLKVPESRSNWTIGDIPMNLLQNSTFIVIKAKRNSSGFLFGDVNYPETFIYTSPFSRLFGVKQRISPKSVLTHLWFKCIKNRLIKYRLYVTIGGGN